MEDDEWDEAGDLSIEIGNNDFVDDDFLDDDFLDDDDHPYSQPLPNCYFSGCFN